MAVTTRRVSVGIVNHNGESYLPQTLRAVARLGPAVDDVLLIDSLGTYYVSPVVDIQQAKDLHAMQTKLACKALFERNPEGLDNPELFKQLFLRDAATGETVRVALDEALGVLEQFAAEAA